MEIVMNNIGFFGCLIGIGAIWFVLPTLVVFPLLYRLRKGAWRSPCNLVDALTIFSVCIIWACFSDKDSMGRGLGWFVDLMAIGFVYGVLIGSMCRDILHIDILGIHQVTNRLFHPVYFLI